MNAQQLRNSILQEAIEGRLVPQDSNEEPASVLLERIRKEKERLYKDGLLKKKEVTDRDINEDEVPFTIPTGWVWTKIDNVAFVTKLAGFEYTKYIADNLVSKENGIPLFKGKNVQNGRIVYEFEAYIPIELSNELKRSQIKKKCLLTPYVGTIGNIGIHDKVGIYHLGSNVGKIEFYNDNSTNILEEYAKYYLMSSYGYDELTKYKKATAQESISIEAIRDVFIPLPPIAEQQRIVAKIEELLPKVEEYGKAQDALNKLNAELPERLKKSILQEAIEGRLVPQDPNDEPASVLLDIIRKEKEQLVKEGKLKKKDLIETPITEDEIPFDIPDSWEWCRLGDIGLFERGNGIKRDETFESGYPCVRYGEMYTKYKYAPTFEKTTSYTSKSVFEKCRKAHKGDLFMALTGENKQDISLAAQYVGDEEIAVGGDLCHFTILEAYGLYFVYLINSTYFSSKKELLATGDIIVHISTDKLASIPIPLPPLAEQCRIVAKIEELFAEIDKLKA